MPSADSLRAAVRDVVDFPKPGIIFKDITPLLSDGRLFHDTITLLCETAGGKKIDKVVGIDARGFIYAAAVADRLGVHGERAGGGDQGQQQRESAWDGGSGRERHRAEAYPICDLGFVIGDWWAGP